MHHFYFVKLEEIFLTFKAVKIRGNIFIFRAMEETKSGLITSLEHLKLTLKPIGVGFWGEVYKVQRLLAGKGSRNIHR